MPIPTSTVPAVKDWLYGQLQTTCTAAAGFDLLVRYGDPGPYDPEDVVSVGDTTGRRVVPHALVGSMGAGALEESYAITVEIDVCRRGTDPTQTATDRAWVLAAQVETAMRSDPTGGGNVLVARPGVSLDGGGWDDNHEFYLVHVEVTLDVLTII